MIAVDPRNPKGIVWLASYPKSGNTWLRMFLYQLMRIAGGHPREPDELNKLDRSSMYEAKLFGLFDQFLGKPLATASIAEVARVRPRIHQAIVERIGGVALVKTHNLLGHIADVPILNPDVSIGAVYILRDPRDVAPSLAKHLGVSIDNAIEQMGRNAHGTQNSKESAFETWGSWSEHVLSWTMEPSEAILVVRYEDMHASPLETFTGIVRHLGQKADEAAILEAIELSSFDNLRSQEDNYDFRERSPRADRFFVAGKVGNWRDKLSAEQAAQIETAHGPLMQRFGYVA